MSILTFLKDFPDSKTCADHFKKQREKEGIICKKCQSKEHYWLNCKSQWECKSCSFRTTLKSGTMMEDSKMSFHKWYLAMAFMSSFKKGISAKELQKQLGQNRYESIWSLMHKIRQAMGKRDNMYTLSGTVEFDEGYFAIESNQEIKKNLKRGRGSEASINVAVMAESTPLEDVKTGKQSSHCRYFKMIVVGDHLADSVNKIVSKSIKKDAILITDLSTSYADFEKIVEAKISEKSSKNLTKTALKWVHVAISNAKRNFNGVYHKINEQYLQNYLDEFCYKLNRRYLGENIFSRLTLAVAKSYW